jgi:hypothetical protein
MVTSSRYRFNSLVSDWIWLQKPDLLATDMIVSRNRVIVYFQNFLYATMNTAVSFFESVITKAHQQISGGDLTMYNLDFAGLLSPRDPELLALFHEVATSLAVLFTEKKLRSFVMFYDTIAFCMRFHEKSSLEKVNPRMIADCLNLLPQLEGMPSFVIGTDVPTYGFGWNEAQIDRDHSLRAVIFPLLDFPGVCLYYSTLKDAYPPRDRSGPSSTRETQI